MLWDQARAAHMDIALDIKSTACRLTLGPLEKRLIIERGIVFTGLSWAKMLKEVQPSFAAKHEHSVNRDIKTVLVSCFVPNYKKREDACNPVHTYLGVEAVRHSSEEACMGFHLVSQILLV